MNIKLNSGEVLSIEDFDAKYELARLLVTATEKVGHLPTFEEAKGMPEMPENLNIYAFYFGSYDKARKAAKATVILYKKPIPARGNEFRRQMMDKQREILDRIMEISFREHGNNISWISEDAIKRDPILIYSEVLKVFGGLKQLKIAAKQRLWEEKHGKKKLKKPKEQPVEQLKEEPSEQLREQPAEVMQPEKMEVEKMAEKKIEKKAEKERRTYRNWTAGEIKNALKRYYEAEGRLPTDSYLKVSEDFPTTMTIKKHLGNTREEWLKAIGVETPKEEPEMPKEPEALIQPEAPKEQETPAKSGGEIEKEIIDLIGQNGKLKQLGDMSDILNDIKIEKQFYLNFGRIRATVNIFATIDG